MTIHVNADLRPVVKDRVGMLHWMMDPEVSGFIIGYDLSGNQVLICNFDVSILVSMYHSNTERFSLKSTPRNHGTKMSVEKLSMLPSVPKPHMMCSAIGHG